jgi:hypothetical protein
MTKEEYEIISTLANEIAWDKTSSSRIGDLGKRLGREPTDVEKLVLSRSIAYYKLVWGF